MRQALTVLRILDFLAFADMLAVSANCNLSKHREIAGFHRPQVYL